MFYGSAQYSLGASNTVPPRELEAAAFAYVNRSLETAADHRERTVALGRNQRLWALLLNDVGLTSNTLPPVLKKDLVTLGRWSMSYSIVAMGSERPLQPLIDINTDMIEALRPLSPVQPAAPRTADQMKLAVAI